MPAPDVMLAFPTGGNVRAEFMMATIQTLSGGKSRIGHITDVHSGPQLTFARNRIASEFLKSPYEWLWMVDSDIQFTPRTLAALMEHADADERPIVGALCFVSDGNDVLPTMYAAKPKADGTFGGLFQLTDWPVNELLRLDATGCGCILIHRSVFDRLSKANPDDDGLWFFEMIVDRHHYGEDMAFCLRAGMAGIPIHVHTGIQAAHIKDIRLGSAQP